jgi:prepilin peptidase CpaA
MGLVALLPFHAYGGMAAGDVKLMAAAGAFLGPLDALLAVATTLAAGSALALAVLAARGGLREGIGHIGRQLAAGSLTGLWVPAAPGTAAAQRFPYAAAIAFGSLAIAAWRWLHMTPGWVG